MFFAVPHHGLDRQDWKKYLKLVLNINAPLRGLTPSSRMEAQAIQNSSVLADITGEFRRLQEYLFFVNYVEGKVMPDLDAPVSTYLVIHASAASLRQLVSTVANKCNP